MIDLAKQHIDIGLFTNNRDAMLDFWQSEIGLKYDHLGKLGGGVHQHRHFLGSGPDGPILKINHARDPLPTLPAAGYRALLLARVGTGQPRHVVDPDGNAVTLVEPGFCGIEAIGVRLAVRDLAQFHDFYGRILQLPAVPGSGSPAYRCGNSVLIAETDPNMRFVEAYKAVGYRYITLQVQKAESSHAAVLARGGLEGMAPKVLGTTVRFSFVRDLDGNFIELSQRASLTGSLEA